MRKGIDFPGVSIVFFCHDGKGNVLLSKRSNNCRDEHGCWDQGGGGLDHGISVIDTLKKEVKEEYGTDVLEYEFLGYRDVYRSHEGERTHWIGLDFKVRVDPSKVRNAEPHKFEAVEWFSLESLPQPLHSQFPHFIEKYRDRL